MRLANSEIISLLNSLSDIADKDIPITFTYRLFDIHKTLQDSYSVYWNTIENIMKKHNVNNPDDPIIKKEVRELLEMMVEVDLEKIKRNELIESNIDLSLSQLAALSPIIEE